MKCLPIETQVGGREFFEKLFYAFLVVFGVIVRSKSLTRLLSGSRDPWVGIQEVIRLILTNNNV